jgi:type III restriction enzyme
LNGNNLTYQFASEEEQHTLDINVEGWTEENLTIWLDRQVHQTDLKQSDLLKWLRDMVSHLTGTRKLNITALMRCKFILSRKVKEKLIDFRKQAQTKVYQQYLIEPKAKVEVSFEDGFEFMDGMYWDQRLYKGRLRFNKHFLGPDNVPAFDGDETGEETQCAFVLDSLPEIKYWVRNVARHPNSFRLPLASGNFYPDFVAMLNDRRILVVEYKGEQEADRRLTDEKRTIGRLWEQKKGGLFIVVEKEVDGKDMRVQMQEKVGT